MDNVEESRNRVEGKQAKRVKEKTEITETDKDMDKSLKGKSACKFYMGGYRKERICILKDAVRESLQ